MKGPKQSQVPKEDERSAAQENESEINKDKTVKCNEFETSVKLVGEFDLFELNKDTGLA